MKRFCILYVILLIATIVFASYYIIGPITVRYVALSMMLIVCVKEKYPFPRHFIISIYIFFVSIFGFTSIAHGYVIDFIKLFIGYYFATFVWIWATYILINKYYKEEVLIYTMISMCFFNACITIGQHYMNPVAFLIPKVLNIQNIHLADNIIGKSENVISQFSLYGIFGMVPNGYYSAVSSVLCLYLFKVKQNPIFILVWGIFLFGLFCVQERAAFVSGVFFSMIYFFKIFFYGLSLSKRILYCCIFIVALFYLSNYFLDFNSLLAGSRYESFDLGTRKDLYTTSFYYIIDNIFTANMFDFYYTTGMYPHNLLYNCFIYGTIIGGTLILFVQIILVKNSLLGILQKMNIHNDKLTLYYCAFLCYMVVALTHNASMMSGDVLFWLITMPIIKYIKIA